MKNNHYLFVLFLCFVSCASTNKSSLQSLVEIEQTLAPKIEVVQEQSLVLTFAGDIMSHSVNSRMTNYDMIYDDVRTILTQDDLSFVNFESPVDNDKSYETYPCFNVKPPYAQAAIRAGFDVFTLANNHSNDQGIESLKKTREFFISKETDGVFHSGLHDVPNAPLSYTIIEKNSFKILFLGVSEFFNAYGESTKYINYVPKKPQARAAFKQTLQKIKAENPVDFFVLAVHVDEPEYIRKVTNERKEYFLDLLDCGVDIIWAHHPHVMQEWELIKDAQNGDKFIMYSMGNFISGQRYSLNLENPSAPREYTGDAFLLQVTANKANGKIAFNDLRSILTTNYVDPQKNVVVKLFLPQFINTLSPALQKYYKKRLELMNELKGSVRQID